MLPKIRLLLPLKLKLINTTVPKRIRSSEKTPKYDFTEDPIQKSQKPMSIGEDVGVLKTQIQNRDMSRNRWQPSEKDPIFKKPNKRKTRIMKRKAFLGYQPRETKEKKSYIGRLREDRGDSPTGERLRRERYYQGVLDHWKMIRKGTILTHPYSSNLCFQLQNYKKNERRWKKSNKRERSRSAFFMRKQQRSPPTETRQSHATKQSWNWKQRRNSKKHDLGWWAITTPILSWPAHIWMVQIQDHYHFIM